MLNIEWSDLTHTHTCTPEQNPKMPGKEKIIEVCHVVGRKCHGLSGKTNKWKKKSQEIQAAVRANRCESGESLVSVSPLHSRCRRWTWCTSSLQLSFFRGVRGKWSSPSPFPLVPAHSSPTGHPLWSRTRTEPSSSLQKTTEVLLLQPRPGKGKTNFLAMLTKNQARQANTQTTQHTGHLVREASRKAHRKAQGSSQPTVKIQNPFLGIKHTIREETNHHKSHPKTGFNSEPSSHGRIYLFQPVPLQNSFCYLNWHHIKHFQHLI